MKLRSYYSVLLFSVILIAASCGQKMDGPPVPKDASVVVHINAGGLSKKIAWEEIRQTNWFSKFYSNADDTLAKKILKDPAASGIDLSKDMVFFTKKQGRGAYMAFEGTLKDAAAFEALNREMNDGAATTRSGELNVMKLKSSGVLSWNDKQFVYVLNAPGMNAFSSINMGSSIEPYTFPADSLQMFGAALYKLPSDESMYEDDRFVATMKQDGDMHVWVNNELNYGSIANGMMGMLKINTLVEDNATGMTLTFDDGKIAVKTRQFFNEQVGDLLEKYPAQAISEEIVGKIPSQNVSAAIIMNYPPEGLKAFLKLTGLDGAVNGYLQQLGFTMDEFVKANKGEILIAVTDLQIKKDSLETSIDAEGQTVVKNVGGTSMKYLFATSINDKPAFDKMVGVLRSQMGDMNAQGVFPAINYKMNNNWFVAGNNEEQLTSFLGTNSTKQAFASRLAGHPFGAYFDVERMLASGASSLADGNTQSAVIASQKMWKDILVTGGEAKDNSMDYSVEINLVDKSTNSLKQLNKYFDVLAADTTKKAGF